MRVKASKCFCQYSIFHLFSISCLLLFPPFPPLFFSSPLISYGLLYFPSTRHHFLTPSVRCFSAILITSLPQFFPHHMYFSNFFLIFCSHFIFLFIFLLLNSFLFHLLDISPPPFPSLYNSFVLSSCLSSSCLSDLRQTGLFSATLKPLLLLFTLLPPSIPLQPSFLAILQFKQKAMLGERVGHREKERGRLLV